jgi:hypothetical protein
MLDKRVGGLGLNDTCLRRTLGVAPDPLSRVRRAKTPRIFWVPLQFVPLGRFDMPAGFQSQQLEDDRLQVKPELQPILWRADHHIVEAWQPTKIAPEFVPRTKPAYVFPEDDCGRASSDSSGVLL